MSVIILFGAILVTVFAVALFHLEDLVHWRWRWRRGFYYQNGGAIGWRECWIV